MALFGKKTTKKEETKKPIEGKTVEVKETNVNSEPNNVNINTNTVEFFCQPYVTEKSTFLSKDNQYAFIVSKDINKITIKHFIEKKYKVKVANVNIIRLIVTPKRFGFNKPMSHRGAYKKAIVTLKQGYKIDLAI